MLGGLSAGAAEKGGTPSEEAIRFAEAAVPVRGSEADEDLQVEVAARLFEMEQASRPTCTPKLLNAKLVAPEEDGTWVERWFVRGCQQILPYRVTFEPDERGAGTAFTAAADVGLHGAPSR